MITAILASLGLDLTAAAGAIAACRRMLQLLRTIPGFCPVCDGAGGDYNGSCWDCQATGHPHLGLCMWGAPRVSFSSAGKVQPWEAHLRSRASVSETWWVGM